jgi:hypothetical protein
MVLLAGSERNEIEEVRQSKEIKNSLEAKKQP